MWFLWSLSRRPAGAGGKWQFELKLIFFILLFYLHTGNKVSFQFAKGCWYQSLCTAEWFPWNISCVPRVTLLRLTIKVTVKSFFFFFFLGGINYSQKNMQLHDMTNILSMNKKIFFSFPDSTFYKNEKRCLLLDVLCMRYSMKCQQSRTSDTYMSWLLNVLYMRLNLEESPHSALTDILHSLMSVEKKTKNSAAVLVKAPLCSDGFVRTSVSVFVTHRPRV